MLSGNAGLQPAASPLPHSSAPYCILAVQSTVCVGSAFGEAAMLLAAGEPGRRAALPSTSIMIRQPMQRYTQMQVGCWGVRQKVVLVIEWLGLQRNDERCHGWQPMQRCMQVRGDLNGLDPGLAAMACS